MGEKNCLTLQEEESLVEQIRNYPILYDKSHKGHKEKVAVENAWDAVAKELDFIENGDTAKRNFETFRKRYQKKKTALKKSKRSGASTAMVEKAQKDYDEYRFFHWYDDFQRPRTVSTNVSGPKKRRGNLSIVAKEAISALNSSTSNSEGERSSDNPDDDDIRKSDDETPVRNRKYASKYEKSEKTSTDKLLHEVATKIKNCSEPRESDSEDLFVRSLAAELRKMPEQMRCMAKHETNQVLSKFQMMMWNQAPTTPTNHNFAFFDQNQGFMNQLNMMAQNHNLQSPNSVASSKDLYSPINP